MIMYRICLPHNCRGIIRASLLSSCIYAAASPGVTTCTPVLASAARACCSCGCLLVLAAAPTT